MKLLDVGCGHGELVIYGLRKGWKAEGFDISKEMIDIAKQNLSNALLDPNCVYVESVEHLSNLEAGHYNIVCSINVIPYFTEEQDTFFYQQCRRALSDHGHLIVSHSNELFDLFTLNRYTVEYLRDKILPLSFPPAQAKAILPKICELLTHPNLPEPQSEDASERDQLPKRRENPLLFAEKLKRFGFTQRRIRFTHYHVLPPLLLDDRLKALGGYLEYRMEDDFLSNLMASIFISHATKD